MRKIAVMTDVHANLPALEAALAAIAVEGCEAIYHTGDALSIGPYPAEVLDRLLQTPQLHLLMGNHDALFAFGLPAPSPAWMSDDELTHQQWTHAQLDPRLRPCVATWPWSLREELGGRHIAFLHYPRDLASGEFAPIPVDPSIAELDDLFAHEPADIICYGHHHLPADSQGQAHYINPGALGCCREPLARFVTLTVERKGHLRLRQHAVPYDQLAVFRAMAQRNMPAREVIRRSFFS